MAVTREDDSRIRMGNAAVILVMTHHLSLNLFEKVASKLNLKAETV